MPIPIITQQIIPIRLDLCVVVTETEVPAEGKPLISGNDSAEEDAAEESALLSTAEDSAEEASLSEGAGSDDAGSDTGCSVSWISSGSSSGSGSQGSSAGGSGVFFTGAGVLVGVCSGVEDGNDGVGSDEEDGSEDDVGGGSEDGSEDGVGIGSEDGSEDDSASGGGSTSPLSANARKAAPLPPQTHPPYINRKTANSAVNHFVDFLIIPLRLPFAAGSFYFIIARFPCQNNTVHMNFTFSDTKILPAQRRSRSGPFQSSH